MKNIQAWSLDFLLIEVTFQKYKHVRVARPNGIFLEHVVIAGAALIETALKKQLHYGNLMIAESLQDVVNLFGQRTFDFIHYA